MFSEKEKELIIKNKDLIESRDYKKILESHGRLGFRVALLVSGLSGDKIKVYPVVDRTLFYQRIDYYFKDGAKYTVDWGSDELDKEGLRELVANIKNKETEKRDWLEYCKECLDFSEKEANLVHNVLEYSFIYV